MNSNKKITRRQSFTGAAMLTVAAAASCGRSETQAQVPKKDLVLNYNKVNLRPT